MQPPPLITQVFPPELMDALRVTKHLVIFTGAGVSAESGIPTFRDPLTGLWSRFDAQDLATPEAYQEDKELVWGWYEWRRMQVLRALPNPAHLAAAGLEKRVPRLTVVTQNVDDLHERAGSTQVLHLHGSLHKPRCFQCGQAHSLAPGIPREPEGGRRLPPPACVHCGGSVRPGVVWFGEEMPMEALNQAFDAAEDCDLLMVIGTSGLVQPAARMPTIAKKAGAKVVQINPTATALDSVCTWSLRGAAGEILPALMTASAKHDSE